MYSFSELIDELPVVAQARIASGGYAVWLAWSGGISQALMQTLEDHGGIHMATVSSQAVWFFADREVFKALARLQIWAKFNPTSLFAQVVPASLLVGWDQSVSLSVSGDLAKQKAASPKEFEVWVHPKCAEACRKLPGMALEEANAFPGLAAADWMLLKADSSYSYESGLGWYFIVKPLGNQLDRDFVSGWRYFFSSAETMIRRMRLKYIFNETMLLVSIPQLRQLRNWCREIVNLIRNLKGDSDAVYWPCVMAVASREKLNFNEDLPRKVDLDWDRLSPDCPHLSYRDALLLGSEFRISQLAHFSESRGLGNWCYVSLSEESEDGSGAGSLQSGLPARLLAGGGEECFYCGLKNHRAAECPSRALMEASPEVWERLALVNQDELPALALEADEKLKDPLAGIEGLLRDDSRAGLLLRALFENTMPFQLRMLSMLWRSRSKDWEGAFTNLAPKEGEYIWDALDSLRAGNGPAAENLLSQAMARYPRSYQPRALMAFLHVENGAFDQALFFFQEAERLAYTPVQRAVFCLLQGRCHECCKDFEKAISLYRQAQSLSGVSWPDPAYRQGVCLVKLGFSAQAMPVFDTLLDDVPRVFNRLLVDPEIERGRFHVLSALWERWTRSRKEAEEARAQLEDISKQIHLWFTPDHEYTAVAAAASEKLAAISEVENYVAFRRLAGGTARLAAEIRKRVDTEVKSVKERAGALLEELAEVQREAAWFPFPKLLREFNRDFNACAEKLNWIRKQPLQSAENFRKSQTFLSDAEGKIEKLKGRLVTLRVVRDSTFFTLLLGRNFIWFELVGLGAALLLVPLCVYLFQNQVGGWLADILLRQKWQLQKGLVVVLSIFALGVAAFKTAIEFERKKRKLFTEEYEKNLEKGRASKGRRNKAAKATREKAGAKG